MIKQLAPLGAKYNISILLAYSDSGAKATVLFTPKIPNGPEIPALSFEGSVDELDAQVGDAVAAGVKKLTEFTSNLEEVQKEIDKAKAEKEAERKAAAEKPKEAAKEKPGKKEKPKPAEPSKQAAPIAEVRPGFIKPKEEPKPASPDVQSALNDLFPE